MKEFKAGDKISAVTIRNPILSLIQNDFPDLDKKVFWPSKGLICIERNIFLIISWLNLGSLLI